MSEFRNGLIKSAILAIMFASLLGTAVYYFVVPQGARFPTIVFALGSNSQISGDYITMYVQELGLIVTFSNGSAIPIYDTGGELTPEGAIIPDEHNGEINATGIKEIMIYTTSIIGISHQGAIKIILRWAENKTASAVLIDKDIIDIGSSKILGEINGVASALDRGTPIGPEDINELPLDVNVTGEELTGYWMDKSHWAVNADQLRDILQSSSNPAIITFTLDSSIYLKYKIVGSGENMTTDVNLKWSGTWGTLQLWHDGGEISSMRYNFSNIKLNVIST